MISSTILSAHPVKGLRDVYGDLPTLGDTGNWLAKGAIALAILWIGWWLVNRLTTDFDDHQEMVDSDNRAFMVIRLGMLAGTFIAVKALATTPTSTRDDYLWLVCGSFGVIVVFLFVLRPALDKLLYGEVRTFNELRDHDLNHAIVQAAFYIADGLIIAGALTGSAPSPATGAAATAVFTLLGLATLLVTYLLAGKLYNLRHTVKHFSNTAGTSAAVILGSIVVGLGLLLNTAIAGDFSGWASGIVGFLIYAVGGFVILVVILPILDKLFLGTVTITGIIKQGKWVAASVMAGVILLVALLLSAIPF